MINNNELQISNKSYINLDFQSIYPELVEIFKKLTNRIDPERTNESDPLIVLLKLMAFVADKENYNIGFNALESFLPSATQVSSFRNLTEINGYTMNYYKSASTTISIQYNIDVVDGDNGLGEGIVFEPFKTVFTNEDGTMLYTLIDEIKLLEIGSLESGRVVEGECKDLTINGNAIIQLSNLDSDNRLYIPEVSIADNWLFVKNDGENSWTKWKQVSNLNTSSPLSPIFKFGYDSNKNLPYIEFPDDIEELVGSGLNVKYFVTKGIEGNIPAKYLTQLKEPLVENITYKKNNETITIDPNYLLFTNTKGAVNGLNPETLDQAYSNFKKTVGTFDVLTTTRDFANYLYKQMDDNGYPLVSNIQVNDRRNDTNLTKQIITYDGKGVYTTYQDTNLGSDKHITPFDLVLYPLQYVSAPASDAQYNATFTPSKASTALDLMLKVKSSQSSDHTFLFTPHEIGGSVGTTYLYKNMYTLNCSIATVNKVNDAEAEEIIEYVKLALYTRYNSRELDYGEEIPYEDLVNTIMGADKRIKNVILDEPILTTKGIDAYTGNEQVNVYDDLVVSNVLAGKIGLYDYEDGFRFEYGQTGASILPSVADTYITKLKPSLTIKKEAINTSNMFKLKSNQVVQAFSPSFNTTTTFSAGVLYRLERNGSDDALPSGTIYKLNAGDNFYINTTTSDNYKYTEKYFNDGGVGKVIRYNSEGIQISTKELSSPVMIMPEGFNLIPNQNPLDDNTFFDVRVLGSTLKFQALDSGSTISLVSKVEVNLANQQIKAYWFMNNSSNALFDVPSGATVPVETILDEGEYFIYTDATMTKVEILGSGTRLETNLLNQSIWTIPQDEKITLDTFTTSSLSTLSLINWQTVNLNSKYLLLEEQQVFTMVEGDEFNIQEYTQDLDASLKSLNKPLNYSLSDGTNGILMSTYNQPWKIRATLNLNVGPDYPQILVSEAGKYIEEIEYNNNNPTTKIEGDANGKYVQLTTLVQRSGQKQIDISEKLKVRAYVYSKNSNGINVTLGANEFYALKIPKNDSISLSIPTITDNVPYITLSIVDATNLSIGNATYTNYNVLDSNNYASNTLQNGLNTLKISAITNPANPITISNSGGTDVTILISSLKMVKVSGGNPKYNEVLGISGASYENKFKDYCKKFYWLYDIPNAELIDVKDFKEASSLWDKNNVCNRMTLPQLDFESSIIKIQKSSLL